MVLGKLDTHMQSMGLQRVGHDWAPSLSLSNAEEKKKNLDTDHILIIKINTKWIIDLQIKCKIIKLLEDNIWENLDDLGFGEEFLNSKTISTTQERKKW